MADQAIDYGALAEQARQSTAPPAGAPAVGSGDINYAALADQARGETQEQTPVGYRNGMPVYSIDVYGRPAPPPQPPVYQGTDEQGKPVIAPPPGPATVPMPWGLRNEPEPILSNLDPRTGEFIKTPPMGSVPLLDSPFSGTVRAMEGFDRARGAKSARDVAGGASEMIRGGLEAATPFLPGAFVGAPLATALTLAGTTALSAGSEAILNKIGVPKEYSALAGDVIGLYGGGRALEKLHGLANLPYVQDSNTLRVQLENAVARAKDPNISPSDRALAKAKADDILQRLQTTAAARDVVAQGNKYGVRLSAGDVTQSPALKNIEVSAEKVPGMGMEPFRAEQQIEAKTAAGGLKSQFEDALVNAQPSSIDQLQEAAEGGDQRARNVLEKMNQAGNDPDRVTQASIGLGDWTTRQQATELYDRVEELAKEHNLGDVPLKATGKAIGSSLEQLRPAKLPNKEVIGLLQKIRESIAPKVDEEGNPLVDAQGEPVTANNTYGLIRQLHSDLGERIREYYQGNNALIGEKGVGHLERVQNALEDDMRNYAKNSGVPEIVDAGQEADQYYKSARVPYKNGMLAAAATSTEPDQIFQQFIKAGKGDRAKNFYDALDDRGQAAVRYNMVAKAVDDAINPQSGIFSPQKFYTAVDKLDEAYGVFFNAKDKAEIQGFKNLMGHVTRAGQYAENPPTGQRVIPYLMAGGAISAAPAAAAHPFLAGSGLAIIGAARGLLTTVKGRDLLLRLNGVKEGTPLMDSLWQKIGNELRTKPPEEPPEGQPPTGGGPPSTPPSGPPAGVAETPASRKQDFIDQVKEFLGNEEGASPSRRGRPMGLQELMGKPEQVWGGEQAPRELNLKPSGKGGELLTSDLGQALQNSVAQRYRLGKEASPERRQSRALESMVSDLRYALAEDDGGRGWYTEDVAKMEKLLSTARPEFKDPAKMALFKYLLGVTSNGVDPEINFDAALRGWDMYKRDGKFSAYDNTKTSEFGNPEGLGLTFRANSYASAMQRLSRLVDEKGEAGAVDWLQTKHPVSELRQYYKDVPGKASDETYGAYALGPKVGAFGSNLNGIHTELTADKWWSRTWNRWMGTLMDTDKEGNVRFGEDGNPLLQDAPRNEGERNLMRETASKVAGDLDLQVSELQAILWYAEQRLYRFYGIDASSVSYADAARKQFGNARPAENAGNGGTAKGGRSNADNGKVGRGPPKIP